MTASGASLLIALLLGAAPALAQEAPAAAAKPAAKPKRICRGEEEIGSLIARSVCHTADEWAVIDRRDARGVDQNSLHQTFGGTGVMGASGH